MNKPFKWIVRKSINVLCDSLWSWTAQPWPARKNPRASLIISPHPDDDVLGCSGLVSFRKARGEVFHVLYLTDGSASHPGHPFLFPQKLALQRRQEAHTATAVLGLEEPDLFFLDLPDGTLSKLGFQDMDLLSKKLKSLIEAHRYDEIFIPLHDDGSTEHESAFRLARPLIPANIRLYEYPVWARWSAWKLLRLLVKRPCACFFSSEVRNKKSMAINCHQSQFTPVYPWSWPVIPKKFSSLFLSNREFFFPAHEPLPIS